MLNIAFFDLFGAVIAEPCTEYYKEFFNRFILIPTSIPYGDACVLAARYGVNSHSVHATFYDSLSTVKSLSEFDMQVYQALHYCSTYGNVECLKNDGDCFTFLPQVRDVVGYKVKIVKTMSKQEAIEKVKGLVYSNIALSAFHIDNLYDFITDNLKKFNLDKIKVRELRYKLIAGHPESVKSLEEFIRVIYYLASYNTMYVRTRNNLYYLANKIPKCMLDDVVDFAEYVLPKRYKEFSVHANRFRKELIILKRYVNRETTSCINKMTKMVKHFNEPYQQTQVERFFTLPVKVQLGLIDSLRPSVIAKLLNADKMRENRLRVFKIRNGRMFYKNADEKTPRLCNTVKSELHKHLMMNKHVNIPKEISYPVPTSLKGCVANLPNFTKITLPKDNYSIGIYWDELGDLDLHCNGDTFHVGWNATHKNREVWHSGDMTRLNHNGYAAEYVSLMDLRHDLLVSVNRYSGLFTHLKLMVSEYSTELDTFMSKLLYDFSLDVSKTKGNELVTIFVDNTSSEDEIILYLLSAKESASLIPTNISPMVVYKTLCKSRVYLNDYVIQDDSLEPLTTDKFSLADWVMS